VLPRQACRLRLTVLYTALFLLSGAVLLVITNGVGRPVRQCQPYPHQGGRHSAVAAREAAHLHAAVSHALLVGSAVALGIMTVVSLVLG
jgi:hypothetical protein